MTQFNINLKEINEEYKIEEDIFTDYDWDYIKLIKIIESKLTTAEQIIIKMYAELASVRKVGQILGVSQSTAYLEITRIKNKIKEWL